MQRLRVSQQTETLQGQRTELTLSKRLMQISRQRMSMITFFHFASGSSSPAAGVMRLGAGVPIALA